MIWLIVVMNIFLALTFTLSKFVIPVIDPLWFLVIRMLVGGLFFSLWYARSREVHPALTRTYVLTIAFLALLNVYITNICQLWSLETLSPAKASLLFNINPFIILILGYLFLRERITVLKIVGLLCGWLGLMVSLLGGNNGFFDYTISYGELLVMVAAFATAISAVVLQKVMRTAVYPLTLTTGLAMLGGAFLSAVHGVAGSVPALLASLTGPVIAAAAVVTIATIVCAGLYAYLLKFYRASFVSFTGFLAPIFAALFDWLLFGSVVPYSFYGAMVLISGGLYLFYRDDVANPDPI